MIDTSANEQKPSPLESLNRIVAECERALATTKNPIFAWQLVAILLEPQYRHIVALPDWLADYLFSAAWGIITPAMSHAHLGMPLPRAEVWARALGLIAERWNAADSFAKRLRELEDLHHWNTMVSEDGENLPAGEATEKLAEKRREAGEKIDERSLQRRLSRARKVFPAVPAGRAAKRRGRLIPK